MCPIEVYDPMHTLLQRSPSFVADMRAVVVITKENRSANVVEISKHVVVGAKYLNPARIASGPLRSTLAIAVFRNDDGFARKRPVDVFQVASYIFRVARGP